MEKDTNTTETTGLLIASPKSDTIYHDVYLRRRRELLRPTVDESGYRSIGATREE